MDQRSLQKLITIRKELAKLAEQPGVFTQPNSMLVFSINQILPSPLTIEDYPIQERNIASGRKGLFCIDQRNQPWLNPIAVGQIINSLDTIIAEEDQPSGWNNLHPIIKKVSKKLFLDGHYANAAEDAFIEINARVKKQYQKDHPGEEIPDGVDLMQKAFSEKGTILLADIKTKTGKDIQDGYRFMFAGATAAFRNPKAHSNEESITAQEAMRRLMFASALMYKLDEATHNPLTIGS